MLYLKKFTSQDLRPPGTGGSNTLISTSIQQTDFFPKPQRPPGHNIKIYHSNRFTILEFGYSSKDVSNKEVRIKSFSNIMNAENIGVGDIGIFKKHQGERDAYDVTFVKAGDDNYKFYESLLSGNHGSVNLLNSVVQLPKTIFRPYNWLVYGAPGTGKSNFLEKESSVFGSNKLRVTFFADYSYSKFVGSYKPFTYYKNTGSGTTYHNTKTDQSPTPNIVNEPVVDYTFVPGPFLLMLVKAFQVQKNGENVLLIIEELNRAAASSVFGEVFQLLDRKDGVSEYRVWLSEEAMLWIDEQLQDPILHDIRVDIAENGVYMPNNFYLWATMNSADQGVLPLDSAFKRRWQVKYVALDTNEDLIQDANLVFAGKSYQWNTLRKAINNYLITVAGVAEDRLISPFFLSREELSDSDVARENVKNKLLLYLKDDLLRHKKGFFNTKNSTLSEIEVNFGPHSDVEKAWDFFSILTQEETGAAQYIMEMYNAFSALNASPEVSTPNNAPSEEDSLPLDANASAE